MSTTLPQPRGRPRDNAYTAHSARTVATLAMHARKYSQYLRWRLDANPELQAHLDATMPEVMRFLEANQRAWEEALRVIYGELRVAKETPDA